MILTQPLSCCHSWIANGKIVSLEDLVMASEAQILAEVQRRDCLPLPPQRQALLHYAKAQRLVFLASIFWLRPMAAPKLFAMTGRGSRERQNMQNKANLQRA
jgi:hypothetical protein